MKLSVTLRTTIAILVSALALVAICTLSNRQVSLNLSNSGLVNETRKSSDQLDSIYSDLIELEAAEHAFLQNPSQSARIDYDLIYTRIKSTVQQLEDQRDSDKLKIAENIAGRLISSRNMIEADRASPEFSRRKAKADKDSTDLFIKIDAAIRTVKVYRTNLMISSNEQLQFATVNNIFIINFLMVVAFSMQAIVWIFVVRYVSERQRVEEALIDREARMHAIVDTAPDGIITVSSASIIESTNSAIPNIFGYAPEEIVGMNIKNNRRFFRNRCAKLFSEQVRYWS